MSREHDQDPHDWEEVSVERWAERRGGRDSTVRYECNQCEAIRWRAEERDPTLDTFGGDDE